MIARHGSRLVAVCAFLGLTAGTTVLMVRDSAAVAADAAVTRIGEMGVQRAAHQATVLASGQVLVTGGCAGDGCDGLLATAELYDPAARSFRGAASMSTPRASHTATLLEDGRVLIAGGCSPGGATARAEVYDAAADRWQRVGDMTEARCSHVAVPLRDGRVFLTGGGGGRLGHLATAEIYDPATATFSPLAGMRQNHYLATLLRDGRVLLTGGQDAEGRILASAEIFDPRTLRFTATGAMATPRVKHAAALLQDGRVLVIGGSDRRGYRGRMSSTEVYDPASGEFSPGPPLQHGRHKIRDAIAVLPSGAILVAGGAVRPERYDPAGRTFLAVRGELSGPLMFATASVLDTGEILVLGGYDERIRLSAAAWLITVSP